MYLFDAVEKWEQCKGCKESNISLEESFQLSRRLEKVEYLDLRMS